MLSLARLKWLALFTSTGLASGMGSRSASAEEMFMVQWLLDAAEQMDGKPRGQLFQAYAKGLANGTSLREHMSEERWQIWVNPNLTTQEKFAAQENTGLEFGPIMAMAVMGGKWGTTRNGSSMLGAKGTQTASTTVWKGTGMSYSPSVGQV
ncbi:hypothetical protein A3843_00175 [Pseudovibrio exalbescens]|uniref:Uncharacterized protein n=2 Tax=Pseudovibrio exalbescens TaxID=197461 RepID=A0A1U7JDD3_9HYPH|nr:hypothetical protein A3843_00175 [Pseudovibrio exalbescens]